MSNGRIIKMFAAQILGFVSLVIVVVITFMKDIRKILVGEITVNLVVGLNYLLLGGYSSAGLAVVSVAHAVVSYMLNKQNKKFPLYLTFIFIAVYVSWTMVSYQSWLDLLPVSCSVLYSIAIIQSQASGYRLVKLANSLIWIVYDVMIAAYSTTITHSFLLVAGIIAIVKLDLMSKEKQA